MARERQAAVGRWLTLQTGRRHAAQPAEPVHGGSIHRCLRWQAAGGDTFVKLGAPADLAVFEAEAAGLDTLRDAAALRVPQVLAVGATDATAVLALEWLDLSPSSAGQPAVQTRLGERLARQHRVVAARFGWQRDNTIGATPQPNAEDDDWPRFYCQRRLGYMLELAARAELAGRVVDRGQRLVERCGQFFRSHRPAPSLLHGDLWAGNWSALAASHEPVVYDPAVYFGDREADIACTRLFGGFGPAFYRAYESEWPLEPGAATRCTLYNLYHVLNHFVLFGGGYAQQAERMIESLLAETG
jgi:protein-ribulosamine 3-kinase